MPNPESSVPKRDFTSWQLDPDYLRGYQAYLQRVRELRQQEAEERNRTSKGEEVSKK